MEPWVSVELDSAWISRFAVNPGTSRMCIFRGAAPRAGQACAAAEGRAGDVWVGPPAASCYLPCGRRVSAPASAALPAGVHRRQHHQWRGGYRRGARPVDQAPFSRPSHYGRMTAGPGRRVPRSIGQRLGAGLRLETTTPRCTLAPAPRCVVWQRGSATTAGGATAYILPMARRCGHPQPGHQRLERLPQPALVWTRDRPQL